MRISSTAERLKFIINKFNIKQSQIIERAQPFCEKFDVKLRKNDLSQYVSGKVEPGQKKLSILALALNVSEAWLMGYDVPMTIPEEDGISFRINTNLNKGKPYLSWQEQDLVNDYVKMQKAIESVKAIPIFDIDNIGIGALDVSFGRIHDYLPLIINDVEHKGELIYVRNNSKYSNYKGTMYPLIDDNDIVLLDYEVSPENGELVIAEYMPGIRFFCRYFRYKEYVEFQFQSQKSKCILNNDPDFSRYAVKGVIKQIIKNIK